MQHSRHIVLVGPMGAGKSVLGRGLAARLGLAFVDVDALVAAAAGMPVADVFAGGGEAAFRELESTALRQALAGGSAVVATGGGAVLAAANRNAMKAAGLVVYLQVDAGEQLRRVAGDRGRPLLQVDDPGSALATLHAVREPLYREVADLVFDTSAQTPDAALDALHALLSRQEARA